MELRHRTVEGRQRQTSPVEGPPSGGLDNVRKAAEELLRAGDEAIDRALSGDSEAFLRASRQEGGE